MDGVVSMSVKRKVFVVGFQKSGTSSMASALKVLGYRVTGPNFIYSSSIEKAIKKGVPRLLARYDAFQDNPWALLYKEMHRKFPDAKFILTVRDPDAWLASAMGHFAGVKNTPMRRYIYGDVDIAQDQAVYRQRYVEHNEGVQRYFSDFPGSLLVMDLKKGDGWGVLCEFLGEPEPNIPFPHANSAMERVERDAQWMVRMKRILRILLRRSQYFG